jgi:hypothetical protein
LAVIRRDMLRGLAHPLGTYPRVTKRRNQDGSTVAYYALAETVWNAAARRAEAKVVHSFGRADQLDPEALRRLVRSVNRVLDDGEAVAAGGTPPPGIEIGRVFDLGVVLAAQTLWEDLGIGPAIRRCLAQAELSAPHAAALFAMAANRLDDPASKRGCAERWLPDAAWLPEAAGLKVDQLYRALDVLAVWAPEIEREVFLKTADLFSLDVDLIFYDTTTVCFEVDPPDEDARDRGGRLFAPLRRRGPSRGGPRRPAAGDHRAGGHPRRHAGALLGAARRHGPACPREGGGGDGGQDQGRPAHPAAGPLPVRRRRRDGLRRHPRRAEERPRPLHPGSGDAQGEGGRDQGADPARPLPHGGGHPAGQGGVRRPGRAAAALRAELALLEQRGDRHPKAACGLMASRRFARYLGTDGCGRPCLDNAKVQAAAASRRSATAANAGPLFSVRKLPPSSATSSKSGAPTQQVELMMSPEGLRAGGAKR